MQTKSVEERVVSTNTLTQAFWPQGEGWQEELEETVALVGVAQGAGEGFGRPADVGVAEPGAVCVAVVVLAERCALAVALRPSDHCRPRCARRASD